MHLVSLIPHFLDSSLEFKKNCGRIPPSKTSASPYNPFRLQHAPSIIFLSLLSSPSLLDTKWSCTTAGSRIPSPPPPPLHPFLRLLLYHPVQISRCFRTTPTWVHYHLIHQCAIDSINSLFSVLHLQQPLISGVETVTGRSASFSHQRVYGGTEAPMWRH